MKQLLWVTFFGAVLTGLCACVCQGQRCQSAADCTGGLHCVQGFCSSATGGGGGTGGVGGTGGSGGSTGGGGGTAGGNDGNGGGGGGGSTGGAGGGGLIQPDAGTDPTYDGGCGPPQPGNPTILRQCAAPTDNECDGPTDSALAGGGVPSQRLNGASGNGFDDDCDGLVDEGCSCPGNGTTKDCYLVPATQVSPSTGLPVGWCTTNAKGSLDCAGGELATWSGVCRGAQPPPLSDTCASGDYNCDGLDKNNARAGCTCANAVQCPTTSIPMAPYPDPNNLPLIDASLWVTDPALRASSTNWTWTILGGDCDNVLPNPTFALYSSPSAGSSTLRGTRQTVKLDQSGTTPRYVAVANEPIAAIVAPAFGNGVAGGQIYPAFGLSGDYIVQGEFTVNGTAYVCTQKVEVRAPGIRAELCWDSVGSNDVDLHFARLQGVSGCTSQGWVSTCVQGAAYQDCFYNSSTGCRDYSSTAPGWGYANSADSACIGWGSSRTNSSTQKCTNPRLDIDNVSCSTSVADPTISGFCRPENINLDNPNDGDKFAVGLTYYGGGASAHPHVNLYCNGQRVLSVGYNPATGQTSFPLLNTSGGNTSGDWWTVGTIKANVAGGVLSCDVETAPSRIADSTRDGPPNGTGGNALCVEHGAGAGRTFVDNGTGQGLAQGAQPVTAAQWCKH